MVGDLSVIRSEISLRCCAFARLCCSALNKRHQMFEAISSSTVGRIQQTLSTGSKITCESATISAKMRHSRILYPHRGRFICWATSPLLFEFVCQMAWMFVIKPCRCFLDAGTTLNEFMRALLSLFRKPRFRMFAHFFQEKPLQRPQ